MLSSGSGGAALQLPRSLPRGRHALPRDIVLVSQSERLVEAIVAVVAEKGYAAARVADIVARAGVSRGTFYQQFRDKEDCFLAAYMAGSRSLFHAVETAGTDDADPLERLRAGTHAYLRTLEVMPAWSRAFLIDIRAVGAAEEPRREVHGWYVDLIQRWRQGAAPLLGGHPIPDMAYEACVDAANEIVARVVERGAFEDLSSLDSPLLYIHLALLGFPDQAAAIPGGQHL
ncbi:MAG: TetR/AcrR family transcriptional regulator [Candidatus Dormibacteria bacterium]